ncbi:MAG: glycine cleavage system protein [Deltaproteobacteria bacterium]|nr:glycine cleavage system protein [Deltaproteobacteria bacterium]
MNPPAGRKYTRSHVWAMPEAGGDVRVGLTHVPGGFLGDAVFVELPPLHTEVFAGEPIGLVESSFTVFEIVSPVTGTVVDMNPGAESVPRQVTRDPYGEGWLLKIRPSGSDEPGSLLDREEYERYAGEG